MEPRKPVTHVELTISCSNLADKDVTSKSDPLCAISCFDEKTGWEELGRTERLINTLNPNFSKKITMYYFFEEVQKLKFSVYDIDNDTKTLMDDDFLGEMECTLGQIAAKKTFVQSLVGKKVGKGTIKIVVEEITDNRHLVMSVKATKLDSKDFMGKSDPFLEFWKENDDGSLSLAHRTEVVKNTLNPVWKPINVPIHTLCGGDFSKRIKVMCSDWDSNGKHDLIGEFYTTVGRIRDAATTPQNFPCVHPKKKAKKSFYKDSGVVTITGSKIENSFSFLEYLFGGLQIHFTVGIDFTGSNGDPTTPDSLHYIRHGIQNEYIRALISVGNVVQDYDSDKQFPAFGFGAKIPPRETLSHEFPLNFNMDNPYCIGINGILSAYQQAVKRIKLWGPTNIAPIINHVARFAQEAQDTQKTPENYYVLLLITDGVVTDIDETRTAIVNASQLPMSIIIVGVGNADFTDMEMLDGDDGILKSPTGQPSARDIVQFVVFQDYATKTKEMLAKAVLAEVPAQIKQYFRQRDMPPGVPSSTQVVRQ